MSKHGCKSDRWEAMFAGFSGCAKTVVLAGFVAIGVSAIATGSALAATCPPSPSGSERVFTLISTPDSSCLAYGAGNLNGNSDAINALGYVTLDKSDDLTTGALPQSLTFTPPTSGLGGTFSIAAAGYTSFVVALKSGEGQLDPDWAAFLLPAGVLSGSWTISGKQELSHAVLYGIAATVPLPAALPLLAGGIGLLGALGWRRRRKYSRAV